ncbi:DNA repair and genetic recombination protein [Candidatus Omnitrophus magneticus]|uniref:DNA repair protein RecN n=1 Tax=Candidatus Omnitrophus magneticus TaxID=1609969 RepID=A0A0F0CQU2_9BACT|nr:DNA repair and genetic recombination protein [Candidatus Omnitrophus magneticus]
MGYNKHMLSQLLIQNFGLIDKLSIDFSRGLNILTGETGAGKSIIIEALRFVLGERVASSVIKDINQPSLVEAVFEAPSSYLDECPTAKEYLSDGENIFIVQRVFTADGRSKIKINGFNLTVTELKNFGEHLVDFHGAGDHQLLFKEAYHLDILDRLAHAEKALKEYSVKYEEYSSFIRKKKEIDELALTRERDIDRLAREIKELEQVSLDENKYKELLEKQARLDNVEKLYQYINELMLLMDDDTRGIMKNASKAFIPIEKLISLDPSAVGMKEFLDGLQVNVESLYSSLSAYAESLSYEPGTAELVARECDIYYEIKRKYGPDLLSAASYYKTIKEKYELLADIEHNDSDVTKKIRAIEKEIALLARQLTKLRESASITLKKTIEKELIELGIKHVTFECRIEKQEIGQRGVDSVIFYISPNAGTVLKPLAEIVSSGEAARVMLALKKALIKVDSVPILIFDEIDAQIGGRLGTVTGAKLKELSETRQVILITHLAQIASFADRHFKVSKIVQNNHTKTIISLLDEVARVQELSAMMSGEDKTDISLRHAKDMLVKAKKN